MLTLSIRSKGWVFFVAYACIAIIVNLFVQNLLTAPEVSFFDEGVALEVIGTNAVLPLYLAVKYVLVASAILMGAILLNYKIKFKTLFKVVLVSDGVLILMQIVRISWLYLMGDDASASVVGRFFPLSLLHLFDTLQITVDPWFEYPSQVLNIFEVCYFLLLTYFLAQALEVSKGKAFLFTLKTYGVALIMWVIFLVFVQLYF